MLPRIRGIRPVHPRVDRPENRHGPHSAADRQMQRPSVVANHQLQSLQDADELAERGLPADIERLVFHALSDALANRTIRTFPEEDDLRLVAGRQRIPDVRKSLARPPAKRRADPPTHTAGRNI